MWQDLFVDLLIERLALLQELSVDDASCIKESNQTNLIYTAEKRQTIF